MGLLSSCSVQAYDWSGFSCHGTGALGAWASVATAFGLSGCASWDIEYRLNSWGTWAQLPLSICSAPQQLVMSNWCGILPDQERNPCLLHWQVDSLPVNHQGEALVWIFRMSCDVRFPVNSNITDNVSNFRFLWKKNQCKCFYSTLNLTNIDRQF